MDAQHEYRDDDDTFTTREDDDPAAHGASTPRYVHRAAAGLTVDIAGKTLGGGCLNSARRDSAAERIDLPEGPFSTRIQIRGDGGLEAL